MLINMQTKVNDIVSLSKPLRTPSCTIRLQVPYVPVHKNLMSFYAFRSSCFTNIFVQNLFQKFVVAYYKFYIRDTPIPEFLDSNSEFYSETKFTILVSVDDSPHSRNN